MPVFTNVAFARALLVSLWREWIRETTVELPPLREG